MADVVRIEFDRVRKLKCKHRFIREAVRTSGKSITELVSDPFGGYPFLLMALLQPSAQVGEAITLDKASDLIDLYIEKHGKIDGLSTALVTALSSYLHLEMTPTDEEAQAPDPPNAATPVAPGPSDD